MSDLNDDLASLRLPEGGVLTTRRKRGPLAAVVVVVAIAIAAAVWSGRGNAAAIDTVTPTVEAGSVAGTPVLTASGYVVARRRAVVSAKIQGRLAELLVEEGARVNEGEVFARLESTDFRAAVNRAAAQLQRADAAIVGVDAQVVSSKAQVLRAEADLAETRRQLGVAERLSRQELLATDSLDATRSRVSVSEAALAQARAELLRTESDIGRARAERAQAVAEVAYNEALLQNTVIRAPFTGTVVRKMAEVGESVAPIPPGVNISTASGAIVALADLDTLEVEVDVAEANVARLEAAQPVEVIVEAFPERKYKGVLRQVIPTADRTRATVMVKVTILDKDTNLKPEMSAKVTFLEPTRAAGVAESLPKVILVPQTAVVTRGGVEQVFAVVDGVAHSRPVTVGQARQDRVAIVKGLDGTEIIVARPDAALTAGSQVQVKVKGS